MVVFGAHVAWMTLIKSRILSNLTCYKIETKSCNPVNCDKILENTNNHPYWARLFWILWLKYSTVLKVKIKLTTENWIIRFMLRHFGDDYSALGWVIRWYVCICKVHFSKSILWLVTSGYKIHRYSKYAIFTIVSDKFV